MRERIDVRGLSVAAAQAVPVKDKPLHGVTSRVEWLLVASLLLVALLQAFSYPYFPDSSTDMDADDGYPYYARYIDEHHDMA